MRKRFWTGFSAGAAAGVTAAGASLLAWRAWGRARNGRVLRLEKSIQIGRPVDEVFGAWSRLEQLPNRTSLVREVRTEGQRSKWILNAAGHLVNWRAEITQLLPNQAIGWKSISGPKHTGRIDFSPLGSDTLVHITMNWAPPAKMANLFSPVGSKLEHYIEQALRDFKASLEGKGQENWLEASERMPMSTSGTPAMNEQRATGTYGAGLNHNPALDQHTQSSRFGGAPETVEYTRPPEAKS